MAQVEVRSELEVEAQVEAQQVNSELEMTTTRTGKGTTFSPHLFRRRTVPRSSGTRTSAPDPEQRLTLLASRLAVLEKLATGLGYLAFIWATVVLMGGLVVKLVSFDFWVIAVLLLTEGTRVFSRSSELKWQQTNVDFFDASSRLLLSRSKKMFSNLCSHLSSLQAWISSKQQVMNPGPSRIPPSGGRRTWSWGAVHLNFLTPRAMSLVLYVVQLVSALVSIGLSLTRLIQQDYGPVDSDCYNRNSALNLFYSLVLAEASVFLLGRACSLRLRDLLLKVSEEYGLTEDDLGNVKQFYYKVYSTCLNYSIFTGLDLDLVGYSLEKMLSSIREEQLGSVKLLRALAAKEKPSSEAIRRRIGSSPGALERLTEMITWSHDKEIRKAVSRVLGYLVQQSNNCYRLTAIAGALEGIATLLLRAEEDDTRLDGLYILKHLAKDHRNCIRVGNTTELIPILVLCIDEARVQVVLAKATTKWKVVKKALQLLQLMADTGGESGRSLRNKIASTVYSIQNLQGILCMDVQYAELQAIALDVFKSLANDDAVREQIGATGGVIPSLLSMFKSDELEDMQTTKSFRVSSKAGEALKLLAFRSPKNCTRILNRKHYKQQVSVSQTLKELIEMLYSQSKRRDDAARILRSLCKNLSKEVIPQVKEAAPRVLSMALKSLDREEEAGISLLSAIVPLLDDQSYEELLGSVEKKQLLADKMIQLVSLAKPPAHLNRIRRYSVELVNALVCRDAFFMQVFKKDGIMERRLERMLGTVSDVENFYTFSRGMGLTRHSKSIEEIITSALSKL